MIIALLALALAMIVGGLMAIVQGWDIVQVERGWTLVIAGSIGAASGMLLVGIAVAITRLTAIGSDLALLRERIARQEPSLPEAPVYGSAAAVSAGLLAGGGQSTESAAEPAEDDTQPVLPLFLRPDEEAAKWPEPEPQLDPAALKAAGSAIEERTREAELHESDVFAATEAPQPSSPFEDRDIREAERDRDTFAETEDHSWLRGWPESKPEVGPEPQPDEAEPKAPEEPAVENPPVTVIGSYTSGPNRYVMFTDGSIEAETPQGIFKFSSLDELKQFIASGGEGGGSQPV